MRSLLWVWTIAAAGCVSEVEVLDSGGLSNDDYPPGPDYGPRAPASSAGSAALWTDCESALFEGWPADACSFEPENDCEYANGCCTEHAACRAGALDLVRDCSRCSACRGDAECPSGESFCVAGACVPCVPQSQLCEGGWQLGQRNGCAWCVPPSRCSTDNDCGSNERCHAGSLCLPGCTNDPRCCFGNVCGAPECSAPSELDASSQLDCAVVGCADGQRCRIADERVSCACTDRMWQCSSETANVCAPF